MPVTEQDLARELAHLEDRLGIGRGQLPIPAFPVPRPRNQKGAIPQRGLAGAVTPEEGSPGDHSGEVRARLLSLALEAYRHRKISRGKLHELGRMVDTEETEVDDLLELLGILDEDIEDEVLLPGG